MHRHENLSDKKVDPQVCGTYPATWINGCDIVGKDRKLIIRSTHAEDSEQLTTTVCGYKFNHLVAKLTTLTVSRSASFKGQR